MHTKLEWGKVFDIPVFMYYLYIVATNRIYCHSAKEKFPIKITLPDGKEVDGKAWQTTPYEIAASIRFVF